MSFSFLPIASSSSGNSTIIMAGSSMVLVDIGITYKLLNSVLLNNRIDIKNISALLITHAHYDHIKGLRVFLNKTNDIKVYTREKTKNILIKNDPGLSLHLDRFIEIKESSFNINELNIKWCKLSHQGWGERDNTGEHIGFVFNYHGQQLSYMTDLGEMDERIIDLHRSSDIFFIEANYDKNLQLNSGRPWGLIQRVIGKYGHLSNEQTAEYLYELVDVQKTKHIFLAHISKECNCRELAVKTIKEKLKAKQGLDLERIKIEHETEKVYPCLTKTLESCIIKL